MTSAAETTAEAQGLRQFASDMGLALSAGDADILLRYLDLLERWNAVYNLTAVHGRAAMLTQHLLDCLAIIEPFRRVIKALPQPPTKRILDVGSGGGLPGVVLAVLLPDWSVVCVDSVGKKATFCRQVAAELGISNLESVHGRAELLRLPPFGAICARAFSSLLRLVEVTQHQLVPEGVYAAMKGKCPDDEVAELLDAVPTIDVFHVEQVAVPRLNAERCIVWMRRSLPQTLAN